MDTIDKCKTACSVLVFLGLVWAACWVCLPNVFMRLDTANALNTYIACFWTGIIGGGLLIVLGVVILVVGVLNF